MRYMIAAAAVSCAKSLWREADYSPSVGTGWNELLASDSEAAIKADR